VYLEIIEDLLEVVDCLKAVGQTKIVSGKPIASSIRNHGAWGLMRDISTKD